MKKHSPWIWAIGIVIIVLLGVMVYLDCFSSGQNVSFTRLDSEDYPKGITRDVIPQYRGVERALATKCDGKVYVMVSRGEKPTSGYDVKIEKICLERKEGKTLMAVYAAFTEPQNDRALAQMITYPIDLVETNLEGLPDQVQLRTEYMQNSN